jgi:hypothetical protein
MLGLPIHIKKWVSTKMLKVIIRKLISSVITKTIRNRLDTWSKRQIPLKRKAFSLKYLDDYKSIY